MESAALQSITGTEFIQLSSIPFDHVTSFVAWLGAADIFTCEDSMGGVHDYVRHDLYDFWLETVKDETLHADMSIF